MSKRLIGVCIVIMLIFSIFGCAQTAEDTSVTETENTNAADAENVSSMDDKEIAAVCEKIKAMDFTASQPQMEIPSEEIFGELLEERKTMSEENYIDEEAFLALKEIYGQIDFNGVFYQGNQSKANLYKDQFNRFLKGEIPILEKDTGEEVYIYDYQIFKEDIELDTFDLHRYMYYFFDMDGDDNPEICIQVDGNSYFVIKYDEESNQIISWLEMIRTPQIILGTKKLGYSGSNMKALFVLNDDGEWEYGVWFKTEYNEDGFWYMVSLPRYYTQNGISFELDDKIKKQGIFDADQHLYYFPVTEEQYNELSEEYNNAVKTSGEAVKEVCYAYEELFF